MSNLREQILAMDDIPEEVVTVPEWNDAQVLVRGLDGNGRAQWLEGAFDENGKSDFRRIMPELIIATAHDPETREPIFEPADRDALNTKSASATERIGKAAMRLSGLGDEAEAEGKAGSGKADESSSK